jgi:hypothetical protein
MTVYTAAAVPGLPSAERRGYVATSTAIYILLFICVRILLYVCYVYVSAYFYLAAEEGIRGNEYCYLHVSAY